MIRAVITLIESDMHTAAGLWPTLTIEACKRAGLSTPASPPRHEPLVNARRDRSGNVGDVLVLSYLLDAWPGMNLAEAVCAELPGSKALPEVHVVCVNLIDGETRTWHATKAAG